jgi:hypothetical protein
VFVTALCVGSPLAINIKAVLSPYGLSIVLLLLAFHTTSFVAGYHLAGTWFRKSADAKALQRTISFETGVCCLQLYNPMLFEVVSVASPILLRQGCRVAFLLLLWQTNSFQTL